MKMRPAHFYANHLWGVSLLAPETPRLGADLRADEVRVDGPERDEDEIIIVIIPEIMKLTQLHFDEVTGLDLEGLIPDDHLPLPGEEDVPLEAVIVGVRPKGVSLRQPCPVEGTQLTVITIRQ